MIGLRYRGSGDHLESYFVKAASPDAKRALWLKATIFARAGEPAVAEGWAVAFDHREGRRHRAVKHTLPFADASFARHEDAVSWEHEGEHLELSLARTRGRLTSIDWDLGIRGEPPAFHLLPQALYRLAVPRTKTVTPLPDARFDGTFDVDGDRWDIDGWRGMLGHNWGTRHAELYAWFHCNQWQGGEDVVVEAACGRVRVGVLLPPMTTVMMRTAGRDYRFNGAVELAANRGSIGAHSLTFSAQRGDVTVEGRIDAAVEDFVGLYYPNPQGPMTHCLNAKLARAELRVRLPGTRMDLRSQAAALEIGTHRADHGVSMYV